eukprot:15481774-Alexandrium_andersonii.AAC.2
MISIGSPPTRIVLDPASHCSTTGRWACVPRTRIIGPYVSRAGWRPSTASTAHRPPVMSSNASATWPGSACPRVSTSHW